MISRTEYKRGNALPYPANCLYLSAPPFQSLFPTHLRWRTSVLYCEAPLIISVLGTWPQLFQCSSVPSCGIFYYPVLVYKEKLRSLRFSFRLTFFHPPSFFSLWPFGEKNGWSKRLMCLSSPILLSYKRPESVLTPDLHLCNSIHFTGLSPDLYQCKWKIRLHIKHTSLFF